MKKQRRSGRISAVAALCLFAAIPVHACAEGGVSADLPPDVQEGVCYVVDLVDWDGELLDSRICTYGEKLEDIRAPEQREANGRIYRFAGWEPKIAETVTGSAVYTAVYQEEGGAGDDADIVLEKDPSDMSGTPERAAFNTPCPDGPQQVSATSYDVTPFHIETVSGMPGTLEERMDGVQIEGIRIEDLAEGAAGSFDAADMSDDTPTCNEQIGWGSEPSVFAGEFPVGSGPAKTAVQAEIETEIRSEMGYEEVSSTARRIRTRTQEASEIKEEEMPPAGRGISQETEEAPSESLTDGPGKSPQKRRQGLSMPQLFWILAAGVGGAWAAKRTG